MSNIRKANFSDPFIHLLKTPFMQRIADLVRSGHTKYTTGTIPISKAGFLAYKFENIFKTNAGKVAACRARANGDSSTRLLFLHQAGHEQLTWILLFQPGEKQDLSGQNWQDALTDKITITNYELVRQTRPGSTKPAWSWRYNQTQYDSLRNSLVSAIRNKLDMELEQLIKSINRSPGFAPVRAQVKKLNELIQSEWKRRRAKTEPLPERPHHGYIRRLKDKGCRLSELRVSVSKKTVHADLKSEAGIHTISKHIKTSYRSKENGQN